MRPTASLPVLLSATALSTLAACTASPPPRAPAPPAAAAPAAAAAEPAERPAPAERPEPTAARPPLEFIHDDVSRAREKARTEGKALFVDAWAPWCHTCLSMKHYVLTDPSLRPLADRVVFADVDTDRPESAPFLERHEVTVWPTFFVLEPAAGEVIGLWRGAASVEELRELIRDALLAMDSKAASALPADDPNRLLVEAKRAHSAGDHAAAVSAYRRALARGGEAWPRRSEALLGLLAALYRKKDAAACVELGSAHVGEVKGAALPADFASVLLSCAAALPGGKAQRAAREAAVARLRSIVASPPADASADDRADAWGLLAEGLEALGDAGGARAASESKLAVLERAAKEAKTPEAAAAYDYGRAMAYVALGRGEEAIVMLSQREAQMPASYEPPARLAQVLHAMGREAEALAAVERAIGRAYGPRRLRYLKLRAEIQQRLGRGAEQVATLREEVAGYEALPKGHASQAALDDARRRLDEAEKAQRGGGVKKR
ncbi:thioredoxin family protein [Sorangium sp. So ce693]|uniref:thioredoxin family protein n=1 Tax=Sorangium sp. So ce693 TaxID=3133318 RepID=UPI003F5E48B6